MSKKRKKIGNNKTSNKTNNDSTNKRDHAMVLDRYALAKMIKKDLRLSGVNNSFLYSFKRSDVRRYLENPARNERNLRKLSNVLYSKSQEYQRLIHYFAKMPLMRYTILNSKDITKMSKTKLRSYWTQISEMLEMMNLKHEFSQIFTVVFREDVYYGYEISTDESFQFIKLDSNYCRISGQLDGLLDFEFDFSFFDGAYDIEGKDRIIEDYPSEFQLRYKEYLSRGNDYRWQSLNPAKSICIKFHESLPYIIPPFCGVFEALYDIDDYKALRKDREKIGNYKVLIQKLPMKKDSDRVDDFLIDWDTMMDFHNKAADSLPEEVGLITTPMDVTSESFDRATSDVDAVAQSIRDYWSHAGVSQLLFNSEKAGAQGLAMSIKVDEQEVEVLLAQVERWINRKIKLTIKKSPFKVNILNVTKSNEDEMFKRALEMATFGFPTKLLAGAIGGISPIALEGMSFFENDVLGLQDKFIPLSSAHTAGANEAGAPQKKDAELSEEGSKSRDKKR